MILGDWLPNWERGARLWGFDQSHHFQKKACIKSLWCFFMYKSILKKLISEFYNHLAIMLWTGGRQAVHAQLYLALCDPVDCTPPGSSVHGISQARILEWVAISFSRGSSWPRDWTCISWIWTGVPKFSQFGHIILFSDMLMMGYFSNIHLIIKLMPWLCFSLLLGAETGDWQHAYLSV